MQAASDFNFMDGIPSEFRSTMVRARALGRASLQVYSSDQDDTPPELLELLDIAKERLESAGYALKGSHANPRV